MELFKININDIKNCDIEFIKEKYPLRYKKASEYKIHEDFLRSIGAGLLLYKAYLNYDESDLYLTEYGKPKLINNIDFNISHSGDFVYLVKASEMDEIVGIDIEKKENKNLKIMYKVFTKSEVEYINKDALTNFHILWTLKEASLKCVGVGLTLFPNKFSVMNLVNGEAISMQETIIYGKTIIDGDYVIGIVSNKNFCNKFPCNS